MGSWSQLTDVPVLGSHNELLRVLLSSKVEQLLGWVDLGSHVGVEDEGCELR